MKRKKEMIWTPQERPIEGFEDSAMYCILGTMLKSGKLCSDDSLLIVFGGEFDRAVTSSLGFKCVTLTNKASAVGDSHFDAQDIPYSDGSYDHVLAHAGIHHSSRPHQSVCEMYRVARKSVMFFESQDSAIMRLAVKLKLTVDYEWYTIMDHNLERGGVDDLPIPNYVYRWTRREVEKLVRSLDPAHVPFLEFITKWDFNYERVRRRLRYIVPRFLPSWLMAGICWVPVFLFNMALSRYGNVFFVRIEKREIEQPWIKDGVFVPPSPVAVAAFNSAVGERT
jgi:SAM-dependent methyltransferase